MGHGLVKAGRAAPLSLVERSSPSKREARTSMLRMDLFRRLAIEIPDAAPSGPAGAVSGESADRS